MKKLKYLNIKKLLVTFILLQPILDVLTSLCLEYISQYLTLGIIIRTFFLGFIIIYSLIKTDKKYRIKSFIYYALTGIYMCVFLFVCYKHNGAHMILAQIKGLIRAFYFPLILVALYGLFKDNKLKIDNKYFLWTLAEYCLIIFIAKIAGIAYPTYKYGLNLGTCGLFYSANETGAILSILSPILFIELLRDKKINFINIGILVLFIFSILELGTKVPFIAFLTLSVLFLLVCILKLFKQEDTKNYIIKIASTICIGIFILFTISYTPIGKNLEANYSINFIKIGNKSSLDPPIPSISKEPEDIEIEVTDIVSGRDVCFQKNLERYLNSSLNEKVFGNGYLSLKNGELQVNKLVEIDYFDIFFCHGPVGALLAFIPLLYILVLLIIKTIKSFFNVLSNEFSLFCWYTIGISLGIALLAGHTLTAPAVSIYIIFVLLSLYNFLQDLEVKN